MGDVWVWPRSSLATKSPTPGRQNDEIPNTPTQSPCDASGMELVNIMVLIRHRIACTFKGLRVFGGAWRAWWRVVCKGPDRAAARRWGWCRGAGGTPQYQGGVEFKLHPHPEIFLFELFLTLRITIHTTIIPIIKAPHSGNPQM